MSEYDTTARRALAGVRAPDEMGAQDRAWATVHAAYSERTVAAPVRSRRRVALVPVAAVLIGAVAFSPAWAAVTRIINHALSTLRVSHAAALSMPAPGRLLVSNARGTWIVSSGGQVKRLGPWTGASWSPRGKYVAVTAANTLAAVDPNGKLAWWLPTRPATDPQWYWPSGYRVAYRSGADLREVAGDGSGDHLLATRVAPIAPAWRPGHPYQVAYATRRGAVMIRQGDTGAMVWHTEPHAGRPLALSWSPTGTRLVLVTSAGAWLYEPDQAPPLHIRLAVRGPLHGASVSPDGRWLAVVSGTSGASRATGTSAASDTKDAPSDTQGAASDTQGAATAPQLQLADLTAPARPSRTVLSGIPVSQPTWAPNSRWLLVTWAGADQWWFVRATGRTRVIAESRVAAKLGAGGRSARLQLDGWCC